MPSVPVLRFAHPTWCSTTKKQGFAGGEAPRRLSPCSDSLIRRGARRRRDKGLRAVRHHARDAGSPSGFVAPNRPAMPSGSRHHAAWPDAISTVQNNTKTPGVDNVSFWTPIIAPGAEFSLAISHGKSVRSLGLRSGCCTACRPRGDPSDLREGSEAR